ncbi:MAG: alpha-E domain-containing protein [Rhodospirillales bacterium]|nr:MAG: alpha-E domain-containing protein [Rhodospirillales bacterium]
MLSRVAENLYWLARYIERAENTARMVSVNGHLQLDLPARARTGWEPLIAITGSARMFRKLYRAPSEKNVVAFLVSDERNSASIIGSLRSARENARTMRDIMPREAWEQISGLHALAARQLKKGELLPDRDQYLRSIINGAQTITGLLAGTMSQDIGFDFLRMGRNLERADMTSRIIDVRSADLLSDQGGGLRPFETIQWVSVLKSLSGYQMYRQHVDQSVRRIYVLEYLLKDEDFPRAIFHCLGEIERCLARLPRKQKAIGIIRRLRRAVSDADLETLEQRNLNRFIDDLQIMMGELHDCIADTYFRVTAPA